MAILVPALTALRDEFNRLAPGRDKTSDGWIGDPAHAGSPSDHNPDETGNTGGSSDADNIDEVHALDVDADLRKAGWSMQKCVDILLDRHRRGLDNRLKYIIFNKRIWSADWGWASRPYSGANLHTMHAHFSTRYTAVQENDARPWGLLQREDEEMALSTEDIDRILDRLATRLDADPGDPIYTRLRALTVSYPVTADASLLTVVGEMRKAILALPEANAGLKAQLTEIDRKLQELLTPPANPEV